MDQRSKNRHREHQLMNTGRTTPRQPAHTWHQCQRCDWQGWVIPKIVSVN